MYVTLFKKKKKKKKELEKKNARLSTKKIKDYQQTK